MSASMENHLEPTGGQILPTPNIDLSNGALSARPKGTRTDLLPPVMIDQDTQRSKSEAQMKTLYILNAGILPHSDSERDNIAELLKRADDPSGVIKHADLIAGYHSSIEEDMLPPLTHAQHLAKSKGFDVHKEWIDQNQETIAKLIAQRQKDVITKKADHMLNHVEDANDKLSAMKALKVSLSVGSEDSLVVDNLDEFGAMQMRALLDLVRFYELKDYAVNTEFKKSRMNKTMLGDGIDAISSYVRESLGSKTIEQVRIDIAEYLKLERGRMLFWIDHLVGHDAQPAEMAGEREPTGGKLRSIAERMLGRKAKPAELGRLAVRERAGLVDSKYELSDIIWNRLAGIAGVETSDEPEKENEK